MIGRTNATGGAAGTSLSLVVTVKAGASVTATKGSRTVSGTASSSGSCTLKLPEAGTWTVKATLNGQTSDTKTVSVVDSYAVSLAFYSATINVTAPSGATVTLKKGGSTVATKTSTGAVTFTVTETGTYTVEATQNGQSTSGTVNVVSSTTSYSLTLSFVSSTLNSNSWATIRSVSDNGQGANYWSIGDRKAEPLNGTVGSLTLSNFTTYAFILGFNHNAGYEGSNRIHFQLAKTAVSGGTDVALCDSSYNSTGSSAAFRMNTTNTNVGGWAASYMKKTICPAFESVVSADLRSNLKTVTKYTDNVGNASGSVESKVTATTEKFFPLAEYEVFGTIARGNTYEANKQKQYDYYAAGNSKIKYRHDATTTAVAWWLRSPCAGTSTHFVLVTAGGTVSYTRAYGSLAFAPGFCV